MSTTPTPPGPPRPLGLPSSVPPPQVPAWLLLAQVAGAAAARAAAVSAAGAGMLMLGLGALAGSGVLRVVVGPRALDPAGPVVLLERPAPAGALPGGNGGLLPLPPHWPAAAASWYAAQLHAGWAPYLKVAGGAGLVSALRGPGAWAVLAAGTVAGVAAAWWAARVRAAAQDRLESRWRPVPGSGPAGSPRLADNLPVPGTVPGDRPRTEGDPDGHRPGH